jgi:hypothetical protein
MPNDVYALEAAQYVVFRRHRAMPSRKLTASSGQHKDRARQKTGDRRQEIEVRRKKKWIILWERLSAAIQTTSRHLTNSLIS